MASFLGLRFARRRLLPLVVELRPEGLVIISQLAAVLGASASLRSSALRFAARYSLGPAAAKPPWSGPLGHCCTSLGLRALRALSAAKWTKQLKVFLNTFTEQLVEGLQLRLMRCQIGLMLLHTALVAPNSGPRLKIFGGSFF